MTSAVLYHFTCDHAIGSIEADGHVKPMTPWPWAIGGVVTGMEGAPPVVWLTSEPMPSREALGLTSSLLTCDRMEYRVHVGEARAAPIRWWRDVLPLRSMHLPVLRARPDRLRRPAPVPLLTNRKHPYRTGETP